MNIEELTIKEVRRIIETINLSHTSPERHPYKIGSNYLIRTVTNYYTGRLTGVFKKELTLDDVSWIADTGRFSDALNSGNFSEVEPYPSGEVVINREGIIDASVLIRALPRTKK